MCVERVEQGTQDTTLRGSYVQGDLCTLTFVLKINLTFVL